MTTMSSATQTPEKFRFTPGVVKRFGQIGMLIILQAALLFVSAGRWDWQAAWAYLALYLGFVGLNALLLVPKGTALIEERAQMMPTRRWDQVVMALYSLASLALLVVAGLDERLGWSADLGWAVQVVAMAVVAVGLGMFSWSMATNAYFSARVRIQTDRGHRVVTAGPYRLVRHPGYSGVVLFSLAIPLMLNSLWALVPAVVLIGTVVVRMALEDRALQVELEGYKEYAAQVRHRLIPGIW